jgi:CubicO group peptidase (beta-lactamase class C family)
MRRVGSVVGAVVAVAALAGCTASAGTATTPAPAATGLNTDPGADAGVPIADGAIAAAIDKLPALASSILSQSGVPGLAVGVTYQGRTVFAQGFGVRKVGTQDAVDADTVFQLASLSKPVGATVVADEVGKGTVSWTTPVAKNLTSFELADPYVTDHATIADLYAHRSGLPDHAGDDLEELGYDRAEVLSRLRYLPLDPFRAQWTYTNFGITAAAQSVADAAGTDWETLSQNDIYGPLGMSSTSSRFSDYIARTDRAVPHVLVDGQYEAKYQRQPDAQSPAGGVSSSVNDMTKWMAMVLDGGRYGGHEIVSEKALLPAISPQIVTGPVANAETRPGQYGYGFNVGVAASGRTTVSHSGAFALGAGTNFVLLPSADLGIVVLVNAAANGTAETLAMQFLDLVQYGAPRTDWGALYRDAFAHLDAPIGDLAGQAPPASPVQAAPLSSYVGTYQNPYTGPATVADTGGTLTITLGPKNTVYTLKHWTGNEFVAPLDSENAPPGSVSSIAFSPPAEGRSASFVFERYATEGVGTFTR